ncbi:MAG: sigma 54-interacting transcriptional regulator [Kofleriaceae bacterium]
MARDDYEDIDTDVAKEPAGGGSPPLCAMISVDGVVTSVPLPDVGDVRIGRTASCDVVVQHKSVSRHHATLRITRGDPPLEITDAGSRNGTRLRGSALAAGVPTSLTIGEALQLGEVTVLIHPRALAIDASITLDPETATPDAIARMLEIECARSARSRSPFAYVRVHLDGKPDLREAHDYLVAALRTSDAIGIDAPGVYQVLLLDTGAQQARIAADRITQLLGQHGITARMGIARYPHDGVTPEQLTAHAWEQLARAQNGATTPTAMDEVRALVGQAATADLSVLITGETGVGKELCAEMIHRLSPRAAKPFVKLNCSVFVESLIESELFGHERGAFTGAVASRAGLLEAGDGGTVFLDEIGELPLQVQAKLLRVLEERVVRRVGASTGKTLDVRFVCATNRSLADEVEAGRFRRDLYYRINVVSIAIPPLRERTVEIAPLAKAFSMRARGIPLVLGADAIAALEGHAWPGNIRELRNTVERAVMIASGGAVRASHLHLERPSQRAIHVTMPGVPVMDGGASLAAAVAEVEKKRILDTLEQCGGNQTRAARLLGISRNTLLSRLDAYGLPRPRKS